MTAPVGVLVCVKRVVDTSGEVVLTDDGSAVDGRFAGYTMLRLPYAVKHLFEAWLERLADPAHGRHLDPGRVHGLVLHADGSWRKTGDLRIGGYALAPILRAEQQATAAEELAEGSEQDRREMDVLTRSIGSSVGATKTEAKTQALSWLASQLRWEQTLDHLTGYEGARPVRVGNAGFAAGTTSLPDDMSTAAEARVEFVADSVAREVEAGDEARGLHDVGRAKERRPREGYRRRKRRRRIVAPCGIGHAARPARTAGTAARSRAP